LFKCAVYKYTYLLTYLLISPVRSTATAATTQLEAVSVTTVLQYKPAVLST